MNTKSKYKICRRLGPGVYEKCQTQKYAVSTAKKGKGDKKGKAPSEYGLQLIEKQRVRFSYGITERQLRNAVEKAMVTRGHAPSDTLFDLLERRLDNVVYRAGFASTRALARQIVAHGHIMVNGVRVKVPAHIVRNGDVVSVREESKKSPLFAEMDKRLKNYTNPNWVKTDAEKLVISITGTPKNTEGYLNLNTVLEFYSR